MAYFNHAFQKSFLGADPYIRDGGGGNHKALVPIITAVGAASINVTATYGFITNTSGARITTADLAGIANAVGTPGFYGFFFPGNHATLANQIAYNSDIAANGCCPLVLASASLMHKDKIGPFDGGYQESNKSKLINPKYVRQVYSVPPCDAINNVISIGNTIVSGTMTVGAPGGTNTGYTGLNGHIVGVSGGTGVGASFLITVVGASITAATVVSAGTGYTVGDTLTLLTGGANATVVISTIGSTASCCKEFLCGETYYLRLDIKGSPALRFLNKNVYQTLQADGGCCPDPTIAPTAVDSTTIFVQWANAIVTDPYLKDFIFPIVYDESGKAWYPDGSTVDPYGTAINSAYWISKYPVTAHVAGKCAGMLLFGAYVDTTFGTCSFRITDHYEIEPIKILAAEVDYTGDPCEFEGLCVKTYCEGAQGNGYGETVLRDLIMSESYLQNYVNWDPRVREITLGDDILGAVSRSSKYYRYYILHSVPRFNNPTGVYDSDQYLLEIISTGTSASTALETFLGSWLTECPQCVSLVVNSCKTVCRSLEAALNGRS